MELEQSNFNNLRDAAKESICRLRRVLKEANTLRHFSKDYKNQVQQVASAIEKNFEEFDKFIEEDPQLLEKVVKLKIKYYYLIDSTNILKDDDYKESPPERTILDDIDQFRVFKGFMVVIIILFLYNLPSIQNFLYKLLGLKK